MEQIVDELQKTYNDITQNLYKILTGMENDPFQVLKLIFKYYNIYYIIYFHTDDSRIIRGKTFSL